MSLLDELEEWRLAQYARPDESKTEHDLRTAFKSLRFLKKWHQQIASPWIACDITWPPYGEMVLVRNRLSGFVGLANLKKGVGVYVHWFTENCTELRGITDWMPIP